MGAGTSERAEVLVLEWAGHVLIRDVLHVLLIVRPLRALVQLLAELLPFPCGNLSGCRQRGDLVADLLFFFLQIPWQPATRSILTCLLGYY